MKSVKRILFIALVLIISNTGAKITGSRMCLGRGSKNWYDLPENLFTLLIDTERVEEIKYAASAVQTNC